MNPHYCFIVLYLITRTKRKHPGNDRIMILHEKKKKKENRRKKTHIDFALEKKIKQ